MKKQAKAKKHVPATETTTGEAIVSHAIAWKLRATTLNQIEIKQGAYQSSVQNAYSLFVTGLLISFILCLSAVGFDPEAASWYLWLGFYTESSNNAAATRRPSALKAI